MRRGLILLVLLVLCGCGDRPHSETSRADKVMTSLQRLLDDLDRIRTSSPEISDTAVRDELFQAAFVGFVEQTRGYRLPDRFGMFSPGAEAEVRSAMARFIKDASLEAQERQLDTPEERFAAFEEPAAMSRGGTPRFVFFGSAGSYTGARAAFQK